MPHLWQKGRIEEHPNIRVARWPIVVFCKRPNRSDVLLRGCEVDGFRGWKAVRLESSLSPSTSRLCSLSHWSWFPGSSCGLKATVMPPLLSLTAALTHASLWTWRHKSQSVTFCVTFKVVWINSLQALFQDWLKDNQDSLCHGNMRGKVGLEKS